MNHWELVASRSLLKNFHETRILLANGAGRVRILRKQRDRRRSACDTNVTISMQSPCLRVALYLFLVYAEFCFPHRITAGSATWICAFREEDLVILGSDRTHCIRSYIQTIETPLFSHLFPTKTYAYNNERTKSNGLYDVCVNFSPIGRFFARLSTALSELISSYETDNVFLFNLFALKWRRRMSLE